MPTTHKAAIISFICFALFIFGLAGFASAKPWQNADPAATGWSTKALEAIGTYAESVNPTAVMVVQDGRVIANQGDVARKMNVASVRKSLLSALYGIAIAAGRINLGSTLAELGIDDKPPSLTAVEKRATVRDLLMARSGIYHVTANETADIRQNKPQRGSHAPGSFWFYNNWDFNVLGTIYRQQTGEDIFKSFYQRVAVPIGMEDFSPADGRYSFEKSSMHPAYPFEMSARDLARFGQLVLDRGRWNGSQVIPAAWVQQATTPYSQTDRGHMGYGYLWWTLNPQVFGPGAAQASGYGGQHVAIIPSKRLVVVQVVGRSQTPGQGRRSHFVDFLRELLAAAP